MKRAGALLSALLLTACGGGGGGSHPAVPSVPQTTAKGSGSLQFSITVAPPSGTVESKSRAPKYVSPATKSFSVSVAGTATNIDVVSGSPGCNTSYAQPSTTETPVNLQPRGIIRGSDGNIWFVEDSGGSVGTLSPGGAYVDYSTGFLENSLIVGPDGGYWIGNVFSSTIGDLAPDRSSYNLISGLPSDVLLLTMASDRSVWFTPFTSGPFNAVYHLSSTGTFLPGDTISTTTGMTTGTPILGPDNAIWVTENNGTNGFIARIAKSGSTWSLTNEYPLPGIVFAIVNGPDGAIWGEDQANGHIYRITTTGGVSTPASITAGAVFGMTYGTDGAFWLAEYSNNLIARVTPAGAVQEFAVPTASAAASYIAYGSDNATYYSEQQVNKIGRLSFPVACTATLALPTGSATATVTAYDATGGASGSGNKLSIQMLPVTVTANTTNTVNFVLNGVVKSLVISNAASSNPCASSGSVPLNVEALDASGNAIIGPGNYSDAAGDPLTITLTTTDTSGHSTFANGVITGPSGTAPALNWSSGFQNFQTVGATVTGGTIAGSIATDVFGGCS